MSKMIDEAIEALIEKRIKSALEFYHKRLLGEAPYNGSTFDRRLHEWLIDHKPEFFK